MPDDERMKNPADRGFREGLEAAKVRSHTDALLRGTIVGLAIVVAWWVPVTWYWKIAIFLAIMFLAGMIVPAIRKQS